MYKREETKQEQLADKAGMAKYRILRRQFPLSLARVVLIVKENYVI